jgi:hypothetical protein
VPEVSSQTSGDGDFRVLISDFWVLSGRRPDGAIAQLGERLLCKQEVVGSIPSGSTNSFQVSCAARASRDFERSPCSCLRAEFPTGGYAACSDSFTS